MTELKLSVGTDIVEVERIEKSMQNRRFFEKVFGKEEKEYLLLLKGTALYCSAAARFAAKEAFGKAVGCGISGFALSDVQSVNDENGCPHILLSGGAKEKFGQTEFSVSLSHTKQYATAVVLAVGKEMK